MKLLGRSRGPSSWSWEMMLSMGILLQIHVFLPASRDEEGPSCSEPGTRPLAIRSQDTLGGQSRGRARVCPVTGHVCTCVYRRVHSGTQAYPHMPVLEPGVAPGWQGPHSVLLHHALLTTQ